MDIRPQRSTADMGWTRDVAKGAAINVGLGMAWPYLPYGVRKLLSVAMVLSWIILIGFVISIFVWGDSKPPCHGTETMLTYGYEVQGDFLVVEKHDPATGRPVYEKVCHI